MSARAEPGVATPLPGGVRTVLQHNRPTSTENDMTTDKKIARRTLSLLKLAADLGNPPTSSGQVVSKACRVMGYSRQQFYETRRNFQTYGAEGLLQDRRRPACTSSCRAPSRTPGTRRSPTSVRSGGSPYT